MTVATLKSRLGAIQRHHPDDHEAIDRARAELKDAKAQEYVRKLVSEAPPLTPEQRDRLAIILLDPSARAGAA